MTLRSLKQNVYQVCLDQLSTKINQFDASLADLTQGANNDSKSSAGDKHETARAMMQLEYEKISTQLKEAKLQKNELEKINPTVIFQKVTKGCLVKTNKAYLFLSVGMGKIFVGKTEVIILSPQSPLGAKLVGLTLGAKAELNGQIYSIEEIY